MFWRQTQRSGRNSVSVQSTGNAYVSGGGSANTGISHATQISSGNGSGRIVVGQLDITYKSGKVDIVAPEGTKATFNGVELV